MCLLALKAVGSEENGVGPFCQFDFLENEDKKVLVDCWVFTAAEDTAPHDAPVKDTAAENAAFSSFEGLACCEPSLVLKEALYNW